MQDWINGGFFVFSKDIFSVIQPGDTLEQFPMQELVKQKQLIAFSHNGFWQSMDTYKDVLLLNEIWKSGNIPWLSPGGKY